MIRDAVRQFVDNEIRPHREELEFGDLPPYDLLRKFYKTFGIDQMSADSFDKRIAKEEAASAAERSELAGAASAARRVPRRAASATVKVAAGGHRCSRSSSCASARRAWSPRWACRSSLTSAAIMSKGTIAQKKRWARDMLTLDKIGAWAITEPNSGSDAFGSMQSTARRDGDEYVLNGSKTFITNGPYADTIVFICKLDEGNPPAERKVLQFVLDSGMPGLEQSEAVAQDGHALVADRHVVPRRRARRPRPPARRERRRVPGQRRPGGEQGHVRDRALGSRRDGARHHRTLPGAQREIREGTGAVRPPDRRVPAHPTQARQDGSRPAQRREPGVPRARVAGRRARR